MPYGRENDPIINVFLGIVLIILGLAFFFYPPTPGEKLGGRMGNLKAPPIFITRIFSVGTFGFGIFLVRKSIKIHKD